MKIYCRFRLWNCSLVLDEVFDARLSKIQERVEFGFQRRSREHIQHVFSSYCESDVTSQDKVLFKMNLSSALLDLQINLEDQEIEEMFKKMDIDGSESLSLLEFESFVSQPSDLEKWAVSFPLHHLVADAMSCIEREGAHVLEKASNLTESDIQVVCDGIVNGMKKMITAKVS